MSKNLCGKTMKTFKRSISFIDANNHRADLEVEITNRNGYPEFTVSGSYCGGCGQVLDEIKPRTNAQKDLLDMWKNWHLNGMHAGTEKQEQAIKEWKNKGNKYDYDKACEYLKSINMYEDVYDGKPYKYGSGWICRPLPVNFQKSLVSTLDQIEKEEKEREATKEAKSGDDAILEQMEEYGISENMLDACKAYLDAMGSGTDLSDFEEAYQGEYSSDEDFAEQLAEDLGEIDKDAHWPNNCIDWKKAARELMYDYFESNGFYFR